MKSVFCLLIAMATASGATVVVDNSNMNGWSFITESGVGSGQLVNGPSAPPLGTGSAQLLTPGAGDRILLGTLGYNGLALSSIGALSYSTYRTSGGSALAASLQFDIDTDQTDANISWQGRLVYEPYYTQSVSTGTWQTWDTLTTGKNWWFSGAPGNVACSIGSPCTMTEVLAAFPNAGINGFLQFKAGGGWTNFDGNVDNFTIGTRQGSTTFDFEATGSVPEPATTALLGGGLGAILLFRRRSGA